MKVVHKLVLNRNHDDQEFYVPDSSRFIRFGFQRSVPVLWYVWEDEEDFHELPVTVRIVFTGERLTSDSTYIDTAVDPDGLVWHAFDTTHGGLDEDR